MSHLAAAYIKKREHPPMLVYASDQVRTIIETINGSFLFNFKRGSESGFTYDAAVMHEIEPDQSAGMDEMKDNILLAHETLRQMSEKNAREFSSVVEQLKKPLS